MSWEQLNALAAAHRRQDAGQMLRFAQLIIAGQADAKGWQEKQKQLIAEINPHG